MRRRRFTLVFLVCCALVVAAFSLGACARARMPGRGILCPSCNVVLLSIDTLRADHIGAYGYARSTTPNIDRLARSSVLFESAVSQSAWTRPAHASMFTGLYPAQHGLLAVRPPMRLSGDVPTLAERLASAGYQTAAFTGGANMSARFGFDRGFATFVSPGRRLRDSLPLLRGWLGRAKPPFFLFLHTLDVHKPYKSTAADRQALGLERRSAARAVRFCRGGEPAPLEPLIDQYDAAIRRADRYFGEFLKLLEATGQAERTILIVTSDHGEEFGEHGSCFHIRTLYREILHVPLLMRVPGIEARRVGGVVPASVSLAATVLELVTGTSSLPGPSLVPILRGDDGVGFDYVVSETSSRPAAGGGGRVRALTGNKDKLVDWIDQGRSEYFDLLRDPGERRPQADGPGNRRLSAWLERWAQKHPRIAGAAAPLRLPAALAAELRSLGYAQ